MLPAIMLNCGYLEHGLGTAESLVADGDDLSVGQLVRLLQRRRRCSSGHFLLEVQRHVAELLLDVPDDLPLSRGRERVAALSQDLHQVVRQVASSQVQTQNGVRQSIALK